MAETKNGRSSDANAREPLGMLANGSSGAWDVVLDETLSGERRYLELDGPAVKCYFEIGAAAVVGDMMRLLGATRTGAAEIVLGGDARTPVALRRDDEYDDRYFLIVGPPERPVVRWTIAGPDVGMLADALRQVHDDLDA